MPSSQLILAIALASTIGGVSADGHMVSVQKYADSGCMVPEVGSTEIIPKEVDTCVVHPLLPQNSLMWACKGEEGGMEEGPMFLNMHDDSMCGVAPRWHLEFQPDDVRRLKEGLCTWVWYHEVGDGWESHGEMYLKATSPLPDLKTCQDAMGGGEKDMTCGEVKEMYKHSECCGNPNKPFEDHRRLQAFKTNGHDALVAKVRQALSNAHAAGGAAEAKKLADKIRKQAQSWIHA